jgi:hypothetical protein
MMPVGYTADIPERPGPAYALDDSLPAVSGLNGKIAAYGGWQDDDVGDGGLGGLLASLSVPLGHSFGFQADGQVASVDGDFFGRVGGHLFWRNPATGLLGVYGSYEGFDDTDFNAWRIAVEGEAYLDMFTLRVMAGYEDLDVPVGTVDDSNLFAAADIAVYLNEDFKASVGYRHMNDMHMAAAGVEYQLQSNFFGGGTSVFAEGRVGEDDYAAVWAGVRLYLGAGEKSLIRRHREDDPGSFDETARIAEERFVCEKFCEE